MIITDSTMSPSVMVLSTLTVTGTVLPFSAISGAVSVILPACGSTPPVNSMISFWEASTSASATPGRSPIAAATSAPVDRVSACRLFIFISNSIAAPFSFRFFQRHEKGYDILDLLGREDGLSNEILADVDADIQRVEAWHHALFTEHLLGIDHNRPQHLLGPPVGGTVQRRGDVAVELLRCQGTDGVAGKAVTQAAIGDDCCPRFGVAWLIGDRGRH